jgi:hypothetical protein
VSLLSSSMDGESAASPLQDEQMLTRSRRSRCVAVAVLQKLRLEFSVERPRDVRYVAPFAVPRTMGA